jgi:hypothetical protein
MGNKASSSPRLGITSLGSPALPLPDPLDACMSERVRVVLPVAEDEEPREPESCAAISLTDR